MVEEYSPPNDWSETEILLEAYDLPKDWSETEIVLEAGEESKSKVTSTVAIGNGFVSTVAAVLEESSAIELRSVSDGFVTQSSQVQSTAIGTTETTVGSVANGNSIVEKDSSAISAQSTDSSSVASSSTVSNSVSSSASTVSSLASSYESISDVPYSIADSISSVVKFSSKDKSLKDKSGSRGVLPSAVDGQNLEKQTQTTKITATAPIAATSASELAVRAGILYSQRASATLKAGVEFESASETIFSAPIVESDKEATSVSAGISVNDSVEFEADWNQNQIRKIITAVI